MWLLLARLSAAEVVDRILDVVGDRIITQSDVSFEAEFVVLDRSPLPPLNDPAYALEQRLVDYAVLRDLAGDIEVYKPSAAEVDARWARFRDAWPHPEDHVAFLARWGLDDERLQGFIYSRVVVEHYVARNLALPRDPGPDVWAALYPPWIAEQRSSASIRVSR